jgi:hypothetical protein
MILDAVFMAFMAVAERVLWALLIAQAITLLAISPSSYSQQALDVSILGIKPGEWLIGIVTWMLWYATGRLVTGADRTAERQLRAYVYKDHFQANSNRSLGNNISNQKLWTNPSSSCSGY